MSTSVCVGVGGGREEGLSLGSAAQCYSHTTLLPLFVYTGAGDPNKGSPQLVRQILYRVNYLPPPQIPSLLTQANHKQKFQTISEWLRSKPHTFAC